MPKVKTADSLDDDTLRKLGMAPPRNALPSPFDAWALEARNNPDTWRANWEQAKAEHMQTVQSLP